jgi:phosphoenolpyruvate carboxylase
LRNACSVSPGTEPNEPSDKEAPLREDIRLLGRVLGDTIRAQEGEAVYDLVETIRQTAISRDMSASTRIFDRTLPGLPQG